MNPQAGDMGMMVPLEQALLACGATDEERTGIFSRYSLSGDLATAAGTLAAAMPDALTSFGFSKIGALKAMFYLYAALGLLSAVFYQALPAGQREETHRQAALGRSRWIVYKLTALFSLDAFGGGFAVQSIVALWLFQRFGLSLSAVSIFYFCTSILNAFSYLVAEWIAKRVGLVNTMVFTHIPSNLCLIIAAFVPSLPVVLAFLLIRAALSQMDVPTRTSYVMAVVTPAAICCGRCYSCSAQSCLVRWSRAEWRVAWYRFFRAAVRDQRHTENRVRSRAIICIPAYQAA
jgi:hypothetical protein